MENSKMIQWWEIEPNVHLKLTKEYLIFLRNSRKNSGISLNNIAEELKVHEGTIQSWENGSRGITIGHLIKLLGVLGLSKLNLDSKIEGIYTAGKRFMISKPNLPLEIKEEHIQILAHGMFDGTEEHASSGKIGLVYESGKKLEQEMFKELVLNCNFGEFRMNKNWHAYYRFPATLTQILMYYYKFNSLHSRKAVFPVKIMEEIKYNKKLRKLILKAAFVDEGSCGYNKVRDNVCVFSSVNPILIQQIVYILRLMGYSFFTNKPKNNCESIYLHAESLPKFYKDVVVLLPKEYYKRINVELLLKKQERESRIQTQLKLLKELVKEQGYIKIFQVQNLLNLHEASARRRISRLIKDDTVTKKRRGFYEAI
ncbi:helix-turn-helix transcriptional regulator [Candidatus Woesearchaeota archaeon]|nr:helix-turn-helix transcriptional regulator [Candidatus Woesearchaeota archaeon]